MCSSMSVSVLGCLTISDSALFNIISGARRYPTLSFSLFLSPGVSLFGWIPLRSDLKGYQPTYLLGALGVVYFVSTPRSADSSVRFAAVFLFISLFRSVPGLLCSLFSSDSLNCVLCTIFSPAAAR